MFAFKCHGLHFSRHDYNHFCKESELYKMRNKYCTPLPSVLASSALSPPSHPCKMRYRGHLTLLFVIALSSLCLRFVPVFLLCNSCDTVTCSWEVFPWLHFVKVDLSIMGIPAASPAAMQQTIVDRPCLLSLRSQTRAAQEQAQDTGGWRCSRHIIQKVTNPIWFDFSVW